MSGVKKILQMLIAADVKFILVGAYAAIARGSQQRTEDLDICYERTPANYKRLTEVLRPLHAKPIDLPPELKVSFDESSLSQGTNFTLRTDEGRLDLLGELSGVGGYKELLDESTLVEYSDVKCRVASLEQIIRSKEAANRPKDRLALPELRALLELQKRPARDSNNRSKR